MNLLTFSRVERITRYTVDTKSYFNRWTINLPYFILLNDCDKEHSVYTVD